MIRPLYKAAAQQPAKRNADGHAGLWFDKFCDRWSDSWKMSGEQKLEWIMTVAGCHIGTQVQVDECAQRLRRLLRARGGRCKVFTTESRFVTGLGRSHPVENGFAWHPTLGTPFLPGSSVKGMIRSWVEMDAQPHSDCETLVRLLGTPGQAGSVCFLDAIPAAPVKLEADVMTPHYAGWDDQNPPGDWRSPVPIPFLTTSPGTPFLFGLVPCRGVTQEELDTVLGWLRSALASAGAGSKTSVGYGRFATRASDGEINPKAARNPGQEWVESKIEELSAVPGVTPDQTLRGKALAEAWSSIEDPKLKQAALDEIRARWEVEVSWDNPSGRAARRAKAVYAEFQTAQNKAS